MISYNNKIDNKRKVKINLVLMISYNKQEDIFYFASVLKLKIPNALCLEGS